MSPSSVLMVGPIFPTRKLRWRMKPEALWSRPPGDVEPLLALLAVMGGPNRRLWSLWAGVMQSGSMPVTMERSARSMAPITRRHLARLSAIAAEDRELFLRSHPRFRNRVIAVVLAQGAATHHVTGEKGVKDLDVWTFFSLPPSYTRFPADQRHRHVDFGLSVFGRQLTTSTRRGMRWKGAAGSDGTISTRAGGWI